LTFLDSKQAHAAGFSGVRGLVNARIGVADADSGEYYGIYSIASRFSLDYSSIKISAFNTSDGELSALTRDDIDDAAAPPSMR
jgi:hypothetical protein